MKETQFTATLTPVIEVATARSLAHPFIVGLSDGTLPLATFRYYLRQDHQYLEMFGRLHECTRSWPPSLIRRWPKF